MATNISVSSAEECAQLLKNLASQFPQEIGQALWEESSLVLSAAQDQTPVKHGYLKNSGYVTDPHEVFGRIITSVGFSADYAWYVHEGYPRFNRKGMNWGKLPYHEVGKWHFLSDPVEARRPVMLQNLVKRTLKLVGGA